MENFIVFDESTDDLKKILARNHQFLGVNRAVEAVRERNALQGRLGVFWHTQGAGKSYSMVMFTRKVHRKLGGNFTFLVLTDRDDLDTQIYKTFAGCGVADHDRDPCRAESGRHLSRLLGAHKSHVFSLIQKFNREVDPGTPYTERDDIVVITDEAHRTQYGTLALNMRNALPNAARIGFTGTPLFKEDEITAAGLRRVRLDLRLPARGGGRRHRAAVLRRPRRHAGGRHRRLERANRRETGGDRSGGHRRGAAPGAGTQTRVPRCHRRQSARPGGTGLRAPLLEGLGDRQGHAGVHRQGDLRADARPDRSLLERTHSGTGGGAEADARRAGGDLPEAADRLDA